MTVLNNKKYITKLGLPISIMIAGIVLVYTNIFAGYIEISSFIGFSIFLIGSCSLIAIMIDTFSPTISEKQLFRVIELIVFYGGIMMYLAFENLVSITVLIYSIMVLIFISTFLTIIFYYKPPDFSDYSNKLF